MSLRSHYVDLDLDLYREYTISLILGGESCCLLSDNDSEIISCFGFAEYVQKTEEPSFD